MNDGMIGTYCALPDTSHGDAVTLAHGEGGRLTHQFIERHILPVLGNSRLNALGDAAHLPGLTNEIAFTTDSFVVSPLFFPGGDIGSLAVYGTINDLVVSGAIPRWLSLSLIIEEGLKFEVLDRILASIAAAAEECHVEVVAGDTKVVPHGVADKIFISTSGIGEVWTPKMPGISGLQPGHEIVVTGPIGKHGIAILAAREDIGFCEPPRSDCSSLLELAALLRAEHVPTIAMRDATRGGVAAVLHEWAAQAKVSVLLDESQVPLSPDVRGACELLGLDPLHLANEGTMLIAVPAGWGARAASVLQQIPQGSGAARIGEILPHQLTPVMVQRSIGTLQALDQPVGGALPRIC